MFFFSIVFLFITVNSTWRRSNL